MNTSCKLVAWLAAAASSALFVTGCGKAPLALDSGLTDNGLGIIQILEPIATPPEALVAIKALAVKAAPTQRADGDEVDPTVIINLGKEIWKIIQDNKPVVNIKYDYADALPKGVSGPFELHGFSDLQHESYRMYGTNGFGVTVYDVVFTLVHQYNGQYDGKGRYLSTVTVLPSKVDVLWGYTVNFEVAKVATTNVGTREGPVASIAMEMKFRVSTVIKDHSSSTIYQFRGDSAEVHSTSL